MCCARAPRCAPSRSATPRTPSASARSRSPKTSRPCAYERAWPLQSAHPGARSRKGFPFRVIHTTTRRLSMTFAKTLVAALFALGASTSALADLTVGISLPLTGPANGLGIPMQNYIKLWPDSVAGEKLKVILLDDASDPTRAVQNARRFVTEDKVDI